MSPASGYYVRTFGGFSVSRSGSPLSLRPEVERLVAFLCLHPGRMPRVFVSSSLWEDCDERRGLANLRSVLWRLRKSEPDLLEWDNHMVTLGSETHCDLVEMTARAERLWYGARPADSPLAPEDGDGTTGAARLDHTPLAQEFLPGWYEEWAVVERERIRQLRLHCLESIAEVHAAEGRYAAAAQVLLIAIGLDQLRESPRRRLMEIHLAEGNASEVLRHYDEYSATLGDALGLEPSPEMKDLLAEARDPARRPARPSRDAAHALR